MALTYDEHLALCINEECVEIAQAVDKALRFGLGNHHPNRPNETNAYDILKEYYHLQTIMEMIFERGWLQEFPSEQIDAIKKEKVQSVLEHARLSQRLGRVTGVPREEVNLL